MCLYPRLIRNPRYFKGNKPKFDTFKKKMLTEECTDERQLWVAIGCGNCIECKQQKAREWQVRLNEELKVNKHAYFVTLTFSNDGLKKICDTNNIEMVNEAATKAVRLFLERWRKKYKKSAKHWLITELGHTGTERIHLHGLIFSENEITADELTNLWKYGQIYLGDYCNNRTINYIVKYVTKIDPDHKDYKSKILTSAGLGSNYFKRPINKAKHAFKGKETDQTYTLPNGQKINLPIYYRNHLWTEEERQKLWSYTLDKDRTYVRGIEIPNVSGDGYQVYLRVLEAQQKENMEMGYGNINWNKKDYQITLKMLQIGNNEEK